MTANPGIEPATFRELTREDTARDVPVAQAPSEVLARPIANAPRLVGALSPRPRSGHRPVPPSVLKDLREAGASKALGAPPLSPAQVDRIVAILRMVLPAASSGSLAVQAALSR
ncbi:hypothetical protein JCM11754A_23720 [Isoptericola variabilis]